MEHYDALTKISFFTDYESTSISDKTYKNW